MKKLRMIFAAVPLLFVLMSGSAFATPLTTFAADAPAAACAVTPGSPKAQVLEGSKQTGETCTDAGVNNIVNAIVSILSYVVGIVAIIVVLLAGFKYITAAGDSGKITSAKNTLVYAIIGLVIAALAQVIVNTVFKSATDSSAGKPAKTTMMIVPTPTVINRVTS